MLPLMKRVCVDARLIHASGIGTFLKNLLSILSKEPSIELVLLHREQDYSFLLPYTSRLIAIKSSIYSMKEQMELPLKIPACDLFWSPHFNVPLFPIRARKRMVTIHDVYHLAHLKSFSIFKRLYAQIVINGACLFSDCTTTISDFSRGEILKHCKIKPKKLTRIYPGISAHFKPTPISSAVRAKYGLPDRYILSVSNFKPHKNISRLISAFEGLQEKISLVLAGPAAIKHPCSKPITYTGFIEDADLPALYSAAEAFIFPSLYEGFGYPPLEAMACGCPVIAARAASMPEVCEEAALYIDPVDPASIQQGIEDLLNDPKQKASLIQKGFKRVQAFQAISTAKAFLNLIMEE